MPRGLVKPSSCRQPVRSTSIKPDKTGIISAENESTLTLKVPGAPAPVVIAKDQVKTRVLSPNSLMPEGLLNGLEEPDVRSLFLYLRQTSEPK